MKLESNDVDIALDKMTGGEFAEEVQAFFEEEGMGKKRFGLSKANHDRVKHLETATMKIHGQGIDFVNLRTDVYNDDSRIPEVKFGTPEEDALRRDLTINSLFYNLHSREVEDFTKRGISDLKAGIIRTPLSPYETFCDDPLRVLRVLRFGARYQFRFDEELLKVIKEKKDIKVIFQILQKIYFVQIVKNFLFLFYFVLEKKIIYFLQNGIEFL